MATKSLAAIPKAEDQLGPRSLYRMALSVALRSITSIVDVGDLSFSVAKPLLKHIENPDQLRHIELCCPQIGAETAEMDEIWKALITKKFPTYTKNGVPTKDGLHWVDIYHIIQRKEEKKQAEAEEAMRKQFAGYEKAREDNQTHIVSSKLLPRAPGGPRRSVNEPRSKTPLTTIQKVRREAALASRATRLVSNSGQLPVKPGQLQKAPQWMVHEHRVANNPSIKIHVPRKRRLDSGAGALAEKESRLLAIKKRATTTKPATTANFDDIFGDVVDLTVEPSADEDSDTDDIEILFRAASSKKRPSQDTEREEAPKKRARVDQKPTASASTASKPGPATSSPSASTRRPGGLLSNTKRGTGLLSNAPRSSSAASSANVITRKVVETPAQPTPPYQTPPTPQKRLPASASIKTTPPTASGSAQERTSEPRRANGKGIIAPRSRSHTPSSAHSSRASSPAGEPASPSGTPSRKKIVLPSVGSISLPNPLAVTPAAPRRMKKKPVDIFMRPKKVAR